ncbi:hypothetical protein B0H12DRAFT_1243928 [Mycena haematopus]|nr:hypothetical protein B0H12DRAFT_1243928 [Mycena haematopus]
MPPCTPLFYPSPGHEDRRVHDHTKNARYFVVAVGRCGSGVFTEPLRANEQTNGFSGFVQRSCKRWEGPDGVEETWAQLCRQHHVHGCPPQTLPAGFTGPTAIVRPGPAPAASASAASTAPASGAFTAPAPVVRAGLARGTSSLLPPAAIFSSSPLTPIQGDPAPAGPVTTRKAPPPYASVPASGSTSGFPLLRTPTLASIDAGLTSPSSTSTLWTISDLFSPGGFSSLSRRPLASSASASGAVTPRVPSVRAMRPAPSISADNDGNTTRDEWSEDDEEVDENEIQRVYWAVLGMARHRRRRR